MKTFKFEILIFAAGILMTIGFLNGILLAAQNSPADSKTQPVVQAKAVKQPKGQQPIAMTAQQPNPQPPPVRIQGAGAEWSNDPDGSPGLRVFVILTDDDPNIHQIVLESVNGNRVRRLDTTQVQLVPPGPAGEIEVSLLSNLFTLAPVLRAGDRLRIRILNRNNNQELAREAIPWPHTPNVSAPTINRVERILIPDPVGGIDRIDLRGGLTGFNPRGLQTNERYALRIRGGSKKRPFYFDLSAPNRDGSFSKESVTPPLSTDRIWLEVIDLSAPALRVVRSMEVPAPRQIQPPPNPR